MQTPAIRSARFPEDLGPVRALFLEYARELGEDLCFQHFDEELAALPGPYAGPAGTVLLAWLDDLPVGCVALKELGGGVCEMKRLYVRPAGRGCGLGRTLCQALLEQARAAGHGRMVLDTLERLQAARTLYKELGFQEVPAYYHNPLPGVVYMSREL